MSTNVLHPPKIHSQPAFRGILREEERYSTPGEETGLSNGINGWFDRLMLQSGWDVSPSVVLFVCLICAIAVGGAVFVWSENLVAAALACLVGGALPIVGAVFARANRQRKMNQQLPDMINELTRATRSGRSLESCMEIVSKDTPAPLGDELKLCTSKMELGIPVDEAMQGLPSRTGLVSASVLVTALGVHRTAGGDITKVLERLARTIRDREQFLGRLSAATKASQLTAFLMIGLPPLILAFFLFRDPQYFNSLMESRWGRLATFSAVILMIVGSIWVWKILASSRKP